MSETYTPAHVYDELRDLATTLGGRYIALSRTATTEDDREKWMTADLDLWDEVDKISPDDAEAVKTMTDLIDQRLEDTPSPDPSKES